MSVDEIRTGLEQQLGVRLGDGEEAVKQAYGKLVGLRDDLLDTEWDVLLGDDPDAVTGDFDVTVEVQGVKGRVSVKPYIREGRPVSGYTRETAEAAMDSVIRTLPRDVETRNAVTGGLDAVSAVLRLPNVHPEQRLRIVRGGPRGGPQPVLARYDGNKHTILLHDINYDGTKIKFEDTPSAESTVVHEFAHYIDHVMLPNVLGVEDDASLVERERPDLFPSGLQLGVYAHISSAGEDTGPRVEARKAITEWMRVTLASPTMQHLAGLVKGGDTIRATVNIRDLGEIEADFSVDREYVAYLRDGPEMFARAVEQYIASRSGDERLRDYIRDHRAQTDGSALKYHHYWTDDEFEPIAEALDRFFSVAGWSEN